MIEGVAMGVATIIAALIAQHEPSAGEWLFVLVVLAFVDAVSDATA